MVDAQAIDQSLRHQLENLCMGRLEHRRAFDPQAAEFVDIEKTPPVDVIRSRAPTGEAIALAFQQVMQALETFTGERIVGFQVVLDGLEHGRVGGQFTQLVLQGDRQAVGIGLVAQCAESIGQGFQRLDVGFEQLAVGHRANRKVVFVMLDKKRAVLRIEAQGQGAVLQGNTIVAAQERQQQLPLHQRVGGVPLDIKELAIRAQATPLKQVQPPGIVTPADRHVIGDDIEDQPHALFAQRADQAAQRRFPAQLRVDRGRVHHVVAMHRSGAGAQQRRGIDMADAEAGEVRHQRHRIVQGKTLMKLQSQGGPQRLRWQRAHWSRSAA